MGVKIIKSILFALFFLASFLFPQSAFAEDALTGWQQIDGHLYYYNPNGHLETGLSYLPYNGWNSYYYLSEDPATLGQVTTGWKFLSERWYYFRKADNDVAEGHYGAAVTGFGTIDSRLFYFRTGPDEYGGIASMLTGLVTINGNTYYFREAENDVSEGPEGSALTNECVTLNDTNYCFDGDGKMATIAYSVKDYELSEKNKTITKIMADTTLDKFAKKFTLSSGLSVSSSYNEVGGKKLIYTGSKTTIKAGMDIIKEFTNIVIGDASGDGLVNSADLLKIRQHLLGIKKLSGVYSKAADITYDSSINSADLLRVRQHLLGTKKIN